MGKRVLLALLLLAILVAVGIGSRLWLDRVCTEQAQLLTAGEICRAYREWNRAEPWIAALVGHEELDQVGDCYAELLACPAEARAAVTGRLLHWIRVTADYDRICLRSIF